MHPQLLDRPDGTAAREYTGAAQDAARPSTRRDPARRGPRWAPASAATLTGRTRALARETGEERWPVA